MFLIYIENMSHMTHATFPDVWELERFQTIKVTFKSFNITGNGANQWDTYTISY